MRHMNIVYPTRWERFLMWTCGPVTKKKKVCVRVFVQFGQEEHDIMARIIMCDVQASMKVHFAPILEQVPSQLLQGLK